MGLGIYDTMQYINPDVSTICTGMAASMGAVLLTSGEKGKRTSFKTFKGNDSPTTWWASGQASDIEITVEIQKLKKELYEIMLITLRQTTKKCGKMEIEIIG